MSPRLEKHLEARNTSLAYQEFGDLDKTKLLC